MLENISIDFNAVIDTILSALYKTAKVPFLFWNSLPSYIRWGVYIFIFILAIFFALITWKYRDEWRYRL